MGSKGQTGNTFGHTLSFLTLITSFSNTMMRRVSGTMILLLLLVTFHRISTQGTGGSNDWSFCKGSCTLGQGDCDRDTDCMGSLFCGQDNCRQFHSQAHPWADCCMKPESLFTKIFSHDTSFGLFSRSNVLWKNSGDPSAKLFSVLGSLSHMQGPFHLKLCYPELPSPNCNEWSQTSNPVTESDITGFIPISIPFTKNSFNKNFGGLGVNAKGFDGPKHGWWWAAIGAYSYHGGKDTIPGPYPTKVKKVDLYLEHKEPLFTKIFAHDTSGGLFTNKDDVLWKNSGDPSAPLLSVLGSMSQMKGPFHLKLCYPELPSPNCNEWSQTSNPVTESDITGFIPISIPFSKNSFNKNFGGLGVNAKGKDRYTFIDDVPKHGNWWAAIGAYSN